LADAFVIDTGKAQQLSSGLNAAGGEIESEPPVPQARGPLGSSGALERACSEFERGFSTAQRTLVQSLKGAGGEFAKLASGTLDLDQQQAQEVSSIERK
jgi:hypothetical protein